MFRDRKYKSGTKWGLWLWTDVKGEDIRRLHVVKTPVGAICIHWLLGPDPDPWLHDHPVSFLAIVLRGWYREERDGQIRMRRLFNFIRATDKHRITEVAPGTMTLCFMGCKVRDWGLHTPRGFVDWKTFYDRPLGLHGGPWTHDAYGKSIADCKSKFDEQYLQNFQGHPNIPVLP
jgi:hypothetical protein